MEKELSERSNGHCELCNAEGHLNAHVVSPKTGNNIDEIAHICDVCEEQVNDPSKVNPNHWRCLNDSMWSEVPAVKVLAWRMLNQMSGEGWTNDLLEMMYMEDDLLEWAKEGSGQDTGVVHVDSNGVQLNSGDTVTIIKDLNVKGSSLVAKRGTAVRNISLVYDNPEQIEGKVEGQKIVILTKFVKK